MKEARKYSLLSQQLTVWNTIVTLLVRNREEWILGKPQAVMTHVPEHKHFPPDRHSLLLTPIAEYPSSSVVGSCSLLRSQLKCYLLSKTILTPQVCRRLLLTNPARHSGHETLLYTGFRCRNPKAHNTTCN